MEWYLMVLKKYAEFTGRSRRKEYWMFALFNFMISIVLSSIDLYVFNLDGYGIDTIYSLAVLVPTIAVAIRRMHDVGKSGWYCIIPIYNIVLACSDSEEGDNEYGTNPKSPYNELNDIGISEE